MPSSKEQAAEQGIKHYFTGKPCSKGHIAPRYVSTNRCTVCQLESTRRNGGWNARPSKEQYLIQVREYVEKLNWKLLSPEYIKAKSKLDFICERNHDFQSSWSDIKQGRRCPKCKPLNQSARMKKGFRSVEELREFARKKHGGDCLATEPVSMHTRVLWQCANPDHKPFPATVAHVFREGGTWCPACDANRRRLHPPKPQISREAVQSRIEERGGEIVQILGDGVWKGLGTRLHVRCANGHEWEASANNLMHKNSWCPNCRLKGERIVRAILEATFGAKFPKKSKWLKTTTGRKLELDGYCEALHLAFEYQGPRHYTDHHVIATDALKRQACKDNGIKLMEIEWVEKPFPASNSASAYRKRFSWSWFLTRACFAAGELVRTGTRRTATTSETKSMQGTRESGQGPGGPGLLNL